MKKYTPVYLLVLVLALTFGIWYGSLNGTTILKYRTIPIEKSVTPGSSLENISRFERSDDSVDFSGVIFTPWDVGAAAENVVGRAKKPYTIMMYMNGSDLESEDGSATDDLIEMLNSGVDSDLVNVVLFTGGTNRWQNDIVPDNECALWEIRDGLLYEISRVGLLNMGDAGTLSGFIDFSVSNFPADKFALIMWDHGGGSIAGYGHDEKFNNSNLTLLDLNYAFKRSALSDNKLELLGFDSCLMATTEMAVIAADYANYLVASEDLEPGDGWDYAFMYELNEAPEMTGAELGIYIADYFMNYYGLHTDETLTLSVTDLSKIPQLAGAIDSLMKRCSENLLADRARTFRTLAAKRGGTKTFGEGSPKDNDCDMVDTGDMAMKLSDLFPEEAANVLRQLDECVVYNRHNSNVDLKGLSLYYVYGGKSNGRDALSLYGALKTNSEHTQYLSDFFGLLVSGSANGGRRSITSGDTGQESAADEILSSQLTLWQLLNDKDYIMTGCLAGDGDQPFVNDTGLTLWPYINNQNVCLYKTNATRSNSVYVVPGRRNGRDCDIVVLFNEKYPEGKIQGVRNEDGLIIQKGFDEIMEGDKIAFYYELRSFDANEDSNKRWYKGPEFTVKSRLTLDWAPLKTDVKNYKSVLTTDIKGNRFFSAPVPIISK